uniref:General transcription factor IIH subunit 4 n=1 Tax=Mucochytrium quahogii TaxID=96639 RepID=A0A7S2SFL1_9STRA|mmetsp:Transcript_4626/g.8142  ORF Transcript_4626/g.8142 Transcript_4626/m.8142 type:complete len:521 (-) Transcript_4626:9573-11135(-)
MGPPRASAEDIGDLFEYVSSLDLVTINRLYSSCRWSCLGILRKLTPLAKQLVMRLIPVDAVFGAKRLEAFVENDSSSKSALKDAIAQLESFKVFIKPKEQELNGNGSEEERYTINSTFREMIMNAITDIQPNKLPWQVPRVTKEAQIIDTTDLEKKAIEKWTAVLHYIVGSSERRTPGERVVKLLVSMGLMSYGSKKGNSYMSRPKITNKGYEFMLRDIHNQIWTFMRHYTQSSTKSESVLEMLFRMSYCTPGTACSADQLDDTQKHLLKDFDLFGLVMWNAGNNMFYPTSLGVNIVFGQSREERMASAASAVDMDQQRPRAPTKKSDEEGKLVKKAKNGLTIKQRTGDTDGKDNSIFIIAETNFKVYAYTRSSLHVEMLKLFVDAECILPNMIVAVISRQSIRRAFQAGITAEQIIHFMTENAHPLCRKRHRLVPDNITDQIILWEGERNRISPTKGRLYDKFQSEELFRSCVEHAQAQGWLLFSAKSSNGMSMVIQDAKHPEMKTYIKEERTRLNVTG